MSHASFAFPAVLTLLLTTTLMTACGGGSDEGNLYRLEGLQVKRTVDKTGLYDIEVNCNDCDLMVGKGNTVRRIEITGVSNRVTFTAGGSIESIDFVGRSNKVYIPKGQKPRVSNSGSDNHVHEQQ
jgi:hypothetical protein